MLTSSAQGLKYAAYDDLSNLLRPASPSQRTARRPFRTWCPTPDAMSPGVTLPVGARHLLK